MKPRLTVEDLSIRYGPISVLDRIGFSLYPGQMVGLVGRNGCGKTSILNAIARLIDYQGKITLDGESTASLKRAQIAKRVSYMRQNQAHHFGLSVVELIELSRFAMGRADPDRLAEVLEACELSPFAKRSVSMLSGGQRQRVFLAKTLYQDTPLLLVDEGLSSADIYYQLKFLQALRQLTHEAGKTVLLVLHDLQLARQYCDEVIVLDKQKIVSRGEARSVLTRGMIEQVFSVETVVDDTAIRYLNHIEKERWTSLEKESMPSAAAPSPQPLCSRL